MRSPLCALLVLYVPLASGAIFIPSEFDDELPDGLEDEGPGDNQQGIADIHQATFTDWFEGELEPNLRWSFAMNSVLQSTTSEYQDVVLLDTNHFGKVLILDGKMQIAETDEFVYHECLIHPAPLIHETPKAVFIMGGGEASAAREVLKHSSIERFVMCDIDRIVVDFCLEDLTANREAFSNPRLQCVINDARNELENRNEKFDVIVGDLADPIQGGLCNHLYTKTFYEQIMKAKLNDNGIFVTQAGRAGVVSHQEVFSSIHNTIKQVFRYVVAYTAYAPSFADSCGWVMASDEPLKLTVEQIDNKIKARITGELLYLDGATIVSSTILNKTILTT